MHLLPWDDHRARIDGSDLERLVFELLTEAGSHLPDFRIERQESVTTADGQYRIDVTVRFRQLGVDFLVLVECKDHKRPVEREDVQVLADKKRAAGAHKAILFATNGFQRGAVEYALAHGIALIRLLEGALTYETKSFEVSRAPATPPAWADIPAFVGQAISYQHERVCVSLIERGRVDALTRAMAPATH
jgi:restriction system protein